MAANNYVHFTVILASGSNKRQPSVVDSSAGLNPPDSYRLEPRVQTLFHRIQRMGTRTKSHHRVCFGLARPKSREEPVTPEAKWESAKSGNNLDEGTQHRVREVDYCIFVIPKGAPGEIGEIDERDGERSQLAATYLKLFEFRVAKCLRPQRRGRRRLDRPVTRLTAPIVAHHGITELIGRQYRHRQAPNP
ncbi:hypothetical protein MAGR_72830 [Mycolicibacterium agri]|uniref:Uncharacterized protein n=1 Tax=Mycolicibacterium agri TaxID=36811 RepID=A0A7I9WDP6_MYCAG|nr:hypothetical protein MAGR_72830 [Mycolicibacterium agri]